ncbi:multidrug efflux SMR transporter [Gordonia sinesedis]
MITWALLGAAVVSEVVGTMSLRAAVDHPAWFALTAVAYVTAFALLGLTLRRGVAVGVAYGIWGAVGVTLTAVFGAIIFGETLGTLAIIGIGLIIVGVVLVESGSHPAADASADRQATS